MGSNGEQRIEICSNEKRFWFLHHTRTFPVPTIHNATLSPGTEQIDMPERSLASIRRLMTGEDVYATPLPFLGMAAAPPGLTMRFWEQHQ